MEKNNDGVVYIYGLVDPIDKKIKYVGKTVDLKKRYYGHMYSSKRNKSKKDKWIIDLVESNLKPSVVIIEECTEENWEEKEKYYIDKYRSINKDLFNISSGGLTDFWEKKFRKKEYTGACKGKGYYYASVLLEGRRVHFGHFESRFEAAEAYDIIMLKFYDRQSYLNFDKNHVYTTTVDIPYKKFRFYPNLSFYCRAFSGMEIEDFIKKKNKNKKERIFLRLIQKEIGNLYKYSSPRTSYPRIDNSLYIADLKGMVDAEEYCLEHNIW